MKKGLILGLILVSSIITVSGCINSDSGSEKLLGTYNLSDIEDTDAYGNKQLFVQLPENTNEVRIVYNLTPANNYGSGSTATVGVSTEKKEVGSGQTTFTAFLDDYDYLESGPDQDIKGELKFGGGATFLYEGDFSSGSVQVYALT